MAGEPPSESSAPLRRYVRKPVAAQLRCRGAMGPGHLFFDTQDLSVGGAFLRADLLLEQGEELEIEFELPGLKRPFQARARVAWVRRADNDRAAPGMGIEFLGLSAEDRDALADFLEDS
ncbi:MAG TPA: PilZ domain-containing protein [Myxococcales bacterium]|nr:PilZ domain-containing protein [Myxococcales bacterium]